MPSTTPLAAQNQNNPFALAQPQPVPANSSTAPLRNFSGISQFAPPGSSTALTAPTSGAQNIAGIAYGSNSPGTPIPTGINIPSGIAPAPTAPQPQSQNSGNAPTPVLPNPKAPPGFEYGPQGNLQPLNAATPPNVAPPVNPTANVSNFANAPAGNSDLYAALTKNLENYQNVSQQNDQELQAQSQLLTAI